MSESANFSGLEWTSGLACCGILSSLVACWWLGALCVVFRKCGLDRETFAKGLARRLPKPISQRYKIQYPLNAGVLVLLICWCLFVCFLGPIALAANTKQVCSPWNATAPVVTADGTVAVPSTTDKACYKEGSTEFKCGVDGCSCESTQELGCLSPPKPPTEECHFVQLPMCTEGDSDVQSSGLHDVMIMAAIFQSWILGILGFVWFLNEFAILMGWLLLPKQTVEEELAQIRVPYHKFVVSFRGRPDQTLVFTLEFAHDPHAIAELLLSGRTPRERRGKCSSTSRAGAQPDGFNFAAPFRMPSGPSVPAVLSSAPAILMAAAAPILGSAPTLSALSVPDALGHTRGRGTSAAQDRGQDPPEAASQPQDRGQRSSSGDPGRRRSMKKKDSVLSTDVALEPEWC